MSCVSISQHFSQAARNDGGDYDYDDDYDDDDTHKCNLANNSVGEGGKTGHGY
jgi:hypothetical protein